MKTKDAIILQVPYEQNVLGCKGTAKGPAAVVEEMDKHIEIYDRFVGTETLNKVDISYPEPLPVAGLKPEQMVEAVKKETEKYLEKFPVILGGEHSVSIGAIQALKEKYPDLTVFQIDAHADLRNDNSDYMEPKNVSKNAHCCVMRRARDLGCSTVQVGLRVFSSQEIEYIKKHDLKNKIFECPVKASIDEIIQACESDNVYLTIDVDGFDPTHMPGTTNPVQGGLNWYFVFDLLKKLFEKKNVVGADVVEVVPMFPNKLTELGAAQLVYTIIGYKFGGNNYEL